MIFRTTATLLFATAALAAVATAQDPPPALKVEGKTTYEPHDLVMLRAVGADPKAGFLWDVYPFGKVQRATTAEDRMEFAAHPGVYDVVVRAIAVKEGGGFSIQEARATVTIKSCHPPEPPKPDPNPPTPPDPPGPKPPTPPPPGGSGKLDPENAIGRIQFGNAGCSATVIGPRRPDGRWDVLTAAHCISSVGQTGRMTMPASNKTYGVQVVNFDRTKDLCWMVTTESIPDIEYAELDAEDPGPGLAVWHRGYGVDRPRNKETGTVADRPNSQGQIRFILNVSSGDSGGGIFRADTNRVVSSVCCTAGKGVKTSMWGGSTENAIRMRPRTNTDDETAWVPRAIPTTPGPLVEDSHDWQPIDIPTVELLSQPGFGVPLHQGPPATWR